MQLTPQDIWPPPEVQISATSCKNLHLWMSICTSKKQSCKSKLHLATQLFQVVLYKICTLHFETTPQQKDRVETATRKWKVQLESPNLHLKKCQEVAPQGAGKLHLRNRKTTPQGAGKLHLREGQKSTSQGSGLSRERDRERERVVLQLRGTEKYISGKWAFSWRQFGSIIIKSSWCCFFFNQVLNQYLRP